MQQNTQDPRKRPTLDIGAGAAAKRSKTSDGREILGSHPVSAHTPTAPPRRESYASVFGRREPAKAIDRDGTPPAQAGSTRSVAATDPRRRSIHVADATTLPAHPPGDDAPSHMRVSNSTDVSRSMPTSPRSGSATPMSRNIDVKDAPKPSLIEDLLHDLASKMTQITRWDSRHASADAALSRTKQRLALMADEGISERERDGVQAQVTDEKSKQAQASSHITHAKADMRRITHDLSLALASGGVPVTASASASASSPMPDETKTLLHALAHRLDAQEEKISKLQTRNDELAAQNAEYNKTLHALRSLGKTHGASKDVTLEQRVVGLSLHYNELQGEYGVLHSQQEENVKKFDTVSKRLEDQKRRYDRKYDDLDDEVLKLDKAFQKLQKQVNFDLDKMKDKSNDAGSQSRGPYGSSPRSGVDTSAIVDARPSKTDHESSRKLVELEREILDLKQITKSLPAGRFVEQIRDELNGMKIDLYGEGMNRANGILLAARAQGLERDLVDLKQAFQKNFDDHDQRIVVLEHLGDRVAKQASMPPRSALETTIPGAVDELKQRLAVVEEKTVGAFTMDMLATAIGEANQTSAAIEADVQAKHQVIVQVMDQNMTNDIAKVMETAKELSKTDQTIISDFKALEARVQASDKLLADVSAKVSLIEQINIRQQNDNFPASGVPLNARNVNRSATVSPVVPSPQSMQAPWPAQHVHQGSAPAMQTDTWSARHAITRPPQGPVEARTWPHTPVMPPQPAPPTVIERLISNIAEVQNKIAATDQTVATIRQQIINSINSVQSLEQRYQNIMTDEMAKKILSLASHHIPQAHEYQAMLRELHALKTDVIRHSGRMQQQETTAQELSARLKTLDSKPEAARGDVTNPHTAQWIEAADNYLKTVIAKVKELENWKINASATLDIVHGTHADQTSTIIEHTNEISDIKDVMLKLAPLEKQLTKLDATSVNEKFGQLKAAMSEIRTRLEGLETLSHLDDKLEIEIKNITFLKENVEQLRNEAGLPQVDFVNRSWAIPASTNGVQRNRRKNKTAVSSDDV